MQDSTRYALIRKEAAVYRRIAAALENMKPVVYRYDGRCFNRKFSEALDGALRDRKENGRVHIYAEMSPGPDDGYLDIRIFCDDNGIEEKNGINDITEYYRIENSDWRLRMKVQDAAVRTESGRLRLDADRITKRFDQEIRLLYGKADELEESLGEIEDMRTEMEQIRRQMEDYDKRYHYRIKEVFGCCYQLKSSNSSRYM